MDTDFATGKPINIIAHMCDNLKFIYDNRFAAFCKLKKPVNEVKMNEQWTQSQSQNHEISPGDRNNEKEMNI